MDWLRENTSFSTLDQLAIATGVELPTLRDIEDGKVLPNPLHVDAIKRIAPSIPASILSRHTIIEPETVIAARGALPGESMELHLGKVKDLQPGDYVPYIPRLSHERRTGSYWVEVRAVSHVKATIATVNFGGVERNYGPEVSIRFARRA
jgi:hypothetical protein